MRLEKPVTVIILGFLLIGCLINFWMIPVTLWKPLKIMASFASLCALIMLYQYGTLKNSGWLRSLVLTGVLISMLSAVVKILHLAGGNELLMIGPIWIAIFYIIHFAKKTNKGVLDWGKIVWIGLGPITTALVLFTQGLEWWDGVLDAVFLLVLFAYFSVTEIFSIQKQKSAER
jgi:hypothetical protein